MTETPSKPRFYTPAPGKLVAGLLVVELCLFTADRFSLFGLQRGGGWNVIAATIIFLAVILVGLGWLLVALVLRKRFQFGILSLFGLMCVVAVVGGWFSWKWRTARRQGEVVERIERLGGWVLYDYDLDAFKGQLPIRRKEPPWFRKVFGKDFLSDVVCVFLTGTEVTDAELAHFKRLSKLENLYLMGTLVTDEAIEELQKILPDCSIARTFVGRLDHNSTTDYTRQALVAGAMLAMGITV